MPEILNLFLQVGTVPRKTTYSLLETFQYISTNAGSECNFVNINAQQNII